MSGRNPDAAGRIGKGGSALRALLNANSSDDIVLLFRYFPNNALTTCPTSVNDVSDKVGPAGPDGRGGRPATREVRTHIQSQLVAGEQRNGERRV